MSQSKRVAAIDCGTNSIRLLIADLSTDTDGQKTLADVKRTMRVVRLGRGVDATGQFDPKALKRTLEAATDYAHSCREAGVESVRFIATSATRDASNAAEFIDGVHDVFGEFDICPEVITGEQEAGFSFAGVTAELAGAEQGDAPYLVVDIGGGSTVFVRGHCAVEQAISMDIGCVRMTERHLRSDPPTEEQVWAALADITEAVDRASKAVDFTGISTLIGVAGSVTTTTAHALDLPTYAPERIHGAVVDVPDVVAAANDLLRLTREQREALPFMHPGRVDVIGAGALIWRTVVQRLVRDAGITAVRASEHDILDGIAWSQA